MRWGGLFGGVTGEAPNDGSFYGRRARRWARMAEPDPDADVVVPMSAIEDAVAGFMAAHPPPVGPKGADATQEQVNAAVSAWMSEHPIQNGRDGRDGINGRDGVDGRDGADGKDGRDGLNATVEMVVEAVAEYLAAYPPANGKDGKDGAPGTPGAPGRDGTNGRDGAAATDAQVAAQVQSYLRANPPAAGKDGANGKDGADGQNGKDGANATSAQVASAVAAWMAANPPAQKIGTVVISETATVAITAGLRTVAVTLQGVKKGQAYDLYPVPTTANPSGFPNDAYAVHGAVATADNTLRVKLTVPAIILLGSYSITCDVYKVA